MSISRLSSAKYPVRLERRTGLDGFDGLGRLLLGLIDDLKVPGRRVTDGLSLTV